MDRLITLLGRKLPRFLGQLTMTGGLGALMHDLVVGWKKNGTDIIAIHPLYNDKIKGIVADMPELPPGTKLGDYLRDSRVLNKTDISFTVTLSGNEFRNKANNDKAKQAIGKEIVVDVYEGLTKFGQTPLYYMDAYYVENGEKVRIFDELYPDNDFRVVHMALYNEAAQKLVQVLQERGVVKKNLLFVENEVFVSLPKNQFPDAVRHHINHTVWKPGMYRPPEYAYDLLGFDPTMRGNVVRNGKIDVAEYVAQAADILSGVGLYEHTPVLKSGIFPLYTHKVVGYNEGGIRNTNGALLDQWQSPELRQLINLYKNKLALSDQDDDVTLFNALVRRKSYQTQFKSRLEYIKALQALDLLIWLNQFQPQAMGGGTWLDMLAGELKLSTTDLANQRDRLRGQIEKAIANETAWRPILSEFADLKNTLLKNPMVANVRRQVAYKGPDKYREMLEWFERDPEVLKQFRESGTRLIIGGRTFGKDARELFDELKQRAERLGLGDRFAFIENYNIDDAQTIFRGISGSVMLSDEFLEASATSMMKGVTNGAALIGVWGGAEPELFTITEKATGRVIDVFTSGMTHDQLVAGLKSGIYEITNGFLVEYTPSEMSKEEMGGRRPSAASLLNAFVELGRKGSSIEARQNLLYATLASSWKVDIERSQARGHIQLWEQAIKDRMAKNEFLSGLAPKPEEANDLLYKKGTGFEWKFKEFGVTEKVVFKGDVGLLGFLESFHRVRAMGDVGNWSLQFHSAIPYAKGDVLTYLDSLLEGYPSLASVRERLNEYAQQVQANQNTLDKVRITLAALDFMESVARYLASEKRETPSVFSRIWDRAKALVQRASMQKYGRWWRTPTETHRAMSVPVFSLRGNKNDVGIGKFTQLYSFYKEMYATYRIDTFHLLPHYATLSESPYAAVDVNSLNELFIDWTAVKDFEETPENLALLTDNLTDVESVDYKNVKIRERAVALTAWETFRQNELLQETDRSQDFMNFVRENASWIRNYSEFMAYVDVTGRSPLELSADDMEKAKRNEYFTESVNLHLYSQWIAEKQLSEAISAIREDGGHVLFDLPMFRGKNSVDVWKHPEYFRKSNINDPSVQNPGIVRKDSELHMGDLNEDWTDLALWNWTQLKDERFEPFFSPVRRWLNLGFDGIRIDAWHMAYPFGNGQKASGDEPGDLLMGPLAQIIQQKDALPLAEAFENLDGKAARLGFVIVGRDWKTVSTHDIERIYPSEKDLSREIAAKMNEPHSWKNAKFVSFTAGDGSMDKYYPIKIMTHINNMRQSLWRWRMPRPGVKADVWRAPTSLMVHLFNAADTFVKKVGTRVELWASSLDWFQQEWGRDAFISLPGLLLSTGRFSDARNVIKNFARHEKNGLIPNRIWDENNIEYNSADASMWYLDAIRKYIETSGNWDILKEEIRDGETLLSIVRNIVDRYAEGTSYERHNRENRIYMDDDGLIVSPAQATWMDADPDGKDHPVTPRNGKAVEINALWYSNLRFLQGIEFRMLEPTRAIALKNRADLVKKSFNDKFWFEDEANGKTWKTNGGALYDVIDGDPHKAAIRPNMIFAISHGDDLLSLDRQKSVLAAVSNDLLTPYGLRTLSPRDSNYKGTYHTDWAPRDKDQAYHQGTVWPWLIGPYVDALVKIRHAEGVPEADIQEEVKKVLDPLMTHFMTYRNNLPERFHTLPEVFDGDAPHNPGGTRSQAWSVAELLRAYKEHVFNHRGLIAKELVPAGAWHVQSARLLAEKVLPAMEKASLAMTTAGLSYLPQAIRWYQSAVNEGGQAWQNYVGKVKQLPSQIRYFILHEVAGLKEHRRPLSRQDQERLLSSLDQPGMVMNVVSRSDDGLVLDVTPAGESPVRMSFFSSDVPSFYATPDIHALATLKGDDQGVYEVSLQKILFDLSPQVLQTVLKHELREISLLRTGKNPMEAHRQVVEEQGSETIDGVVSALSDHLMKGSIQSLQNMIRANPPTQGVNANIKLPDLFPLPISRPDYLKELIIDVRLSPTTEQEMTQMSLTRVIQGEPGLSSAVFFQGHIEKTLRSGVNLSAVVDRQTLGQKLSEMNAQQRMNLLNSLKTMTDNLSQNKASADDVASFVLELITKAGREEGQIATTTPSPTAAQVQSLNRRFETTAGMIIAVLKQADISVDETFVKTLASVYVQAFQQGRQHLSPLTDADVFLSRKAPDVSGLSVGLFHIPSIRPEILNTHPEIKQTLDKFVQMLRNTDPNAFAAEFLLDDPFETVSPEKAKSQIVDLLSSMVPDDLRDRFNAVRSRIYVMTTPSLPAQALIENRLDLDVIFETIQNSHLSGLGSIGQIQIFTTQPKRFREAWRAKFAWMLYLVLPEGLMVEATRNIDGALKAIQFIETQA
ncbi:MAG TPA: 4-alpha-glucanotransferase [Elusimicrobiota bacterium]|nr:4-alpha-glucanotransferase [Elusimicrobiota bacterium]